MRPSSCHGDFRQTQTSRVKNEFPCGDIRGYGGLLLPATCVKIDGADAGTPCLPCLHESSNLRLRSFEVSEALPRTITNMD